LKLLVSFRRHGGFVFGKAYSRGRWIWRRGKWDALEEDVHFLNGSFVKPPGVGRVDLLHSDTVCSLSNRKVPDKWGFRDQ
jgi:hypothetical protein